MKPDKILITAVDHTHIETSHHSIFKLNENNTLSRFHLKKTFDIALPLERNFFLGFFPNEIKILIIRNLISMYLKEALYELAMPLIAICKYTLVQTYLMYFPKPTFEISVVSYNFRFSHTLHFCQAVVDAIVGCKKSFCDYYVVETRHGFSIGKCYPWYLDTDVSISEMDAFFIQGVPDHRVFSIGSEIHHYAWTQSVEKEGIHYCRYFRAPIIVLAIINFSHLQIITKEDLDSTFCSVKYLLKKVFGKWTGVYIYHPDESPFQLDTVVEL